MTGTNRSMRRVVIATSLVACALNWANTELISSLAGQLVLAPGLPLAFIAGLRMARPEVCDWGRTVFDPVFHTEPCQAAPVHSLLVFDREDLLHLCSEHCEAARRMFEDYPGLG